jgi:hypothetical protein
MNVPFLLVSSLFSSTCISLNGEIQTKQGTLARWMEQKHQLDGGAKRRFLVMSPGICYSSKPSVTVSFDILFIVFYLIELACMRTCTNKLAYAAYETRERPNRISIDPNNTGANGSSSLVRFVTKQWFPDENKRYTRTPVEWSYNFAQSWTCRASILMNVHTCNTWQNFVQPWPSQHKIRCFC